jgi:hypothetical protein
MSTTNTPEIAPVTNLPAARKEQAAARKEQAAAKTRHPAGKRAPAKKAPAKSKVAASKITWTLDGEKDANGSAEGTGVCANRQYRITRNGDGWKVTVKVGNAKPTVIAENAKSGHAAWQQAVNHNKKAA